MGRFKNIEIEGLLIEDFGKIFVESFNEGVKSSNLSEEETLKKIAPKFDELLTAYEEIISTLYLSHHKFNLEKFLNTHFRIQKRLLKLTKILLRHLFYT
jgi:hypothetical protein